MLMARQDFLLVNEKEEVKAISPGPQELGWGEFNPITKYALFLSSKTMTFSATHVRILQEQRELFQAQMTYLFLTRKKSSP